MSEQKGTQTFLQARSRKPDLHGWHAPRQELFSPLYRSIPIKFHLERCRDAWTLQMKDRDQKDLEFFEPFEMIRKPITRKIAWQKSANL